MISFNSAVLCVNIRCLPSVTGYFNGESKYYDIIICKWESNGTDQYNSRTTADKICNSINSYIELFPTADIPKYRTNDQAMINKYIGSTVCNK